MIADNWLRWKDSNFRIMGSKPTVLPLHYTPLLVAGLGNDPSGPIGDGFTVRPVSLAVYPPILKWRTVLDSNQRRELTLGRLAGAWFKPTHPTVHIRTLVRKISELPFQLSYNPRIFYVLTSSLYIIKSNFKYLFLLFSCHIFSP